MPIRQRGDNWYIDVTIKGHRYRQSVPEATCRKDAEKAEVRFKSDLLQGKYDLLEDKEYITFQLLADKYEEYSKINNLGYKKYLSTIKHLREFFGNRNINDITPFLIEKYRIERKSFDIANTTVNREINILRKMFSIAVDNDWIEENPCLSKQIKPLREKNIKDRFLSAKEETSLFEKCKEEYEYMRPIIVCALNTAIRKSNILGLKWDSVNLKLKYIHLLETKNGKSTKIPINNKLLAELKLLEKNKLSEYVFTNPLTKTRYYDILKAFKYLCSEANIDGLVFHDLRHTAATRMVSAGIDLVVVQDILCHSEIKTTMRYSHPVPKRKLEAIEALGNYV
ncbi:MAG: site-specific tyrosine recombinase [Candidatus Wolfebacteria bacterium GW2011_GWC2_39_22]|uniref:Site-specific tyrosine recombinase n=1 Tax=Candidatus Wolfebacteria bacterium GW2011_GWC2_39_22 TaxID=1619013 RepID=A0A0G0N6A5_9BACT|nr:MAG: site-specific tyrosine recombinase [Candidatus Wolfebacteria bacterium GW2011_GWC2_39_22]